MENIVSIRESVERCQTVNRMKCKECKYFKQCEPRKIVSEYEKNKREKTLVKVTKRIYE